MSIDIDKILHDTFVCQVEHHPVLSSTNDRAAQHARELIGVLPFLAVADQQLAGRGRGANRWWTGDGSLAMSLLVEGDMVAAAGQRSPLVSLAVAAAVVDAVTPRLPQDRVGICWPNDVFVADSELEARKLAGILVEVLPDGKHVIGIGINTNSTLADAPPELHAKICTMRDLTGAVHEHTALIIAVLQALDCVFTQLRSAPAAVVARAHDLCLQRGRILVLENGAVQVQGKCNGIGPDGALLLETPAGLRQFVSGVVRTPN